MKKTRAFLAFVLPVFLSGCLGPAWQVLDSRDRDPRTEIQLLRMTSDASQLAFDLKGALNDQSDLVELRYHAVDQDYFLELKDLEKGKLMYRYKDFDIAYLYSKDYDPAKGGKLWIDYLNNAVSGKYKRFTFHFKRVGNDWEIHTAGAKPRKFDAVFVEANRFLGQIIGIDSIRPL